jgi:two-component system phosphate regulon sensor histidine kinase PhoR
MKMSHTLKWRIAILYLLLIVASLGSLGFLLGGLTPTLVIVTTITLLLAFLLALYLAKGITQPVRKLTQMCHEISRGELDQRIEPKSADEIGELVWEFDQMSVKLQERVRIILSQQNKMGTALSYMDDSVLITDSEGVVNLINPAAEKLFQLPPSRAIGHPFVEVVCDYELAELLNQCLKTGKQQIKSLQIGQDRRSLRVTATPIEDSEATGGLVVLQDFTELRRLEEVRREFIANISHELRTPLACIKGLIETLQEGAIEDPIAAKIFLEKANAETDKLAQLLQQLGELSRIESGQVSMNIEPKDINPLLYKAAQRLQVQADRVGLELAISIPADLPKVLADEERIEQVIINLLHNAIKFTPPGGKVSLRAKQDGDVITLSVADTGIGIPNDDLPHIFERFRKVDKSRSSEGTGLGLAIAKHIVQAHGGNIWAESSESKGSTFTFTLPIAP